jgi:hypothetical protein
LLDIFPKATRIPFGGIKGFLHNYMDVKTKIGPLEIHVTPDMIVEVTEIPGIGEQWFKAKKIEKED